MVTEIDVNGEWNIEVLENGVKVRLLTKPSQYNIDNKNNNPVKPLPTLKDRLLQILEDPEVKAKIKATAISI